MKALSHSARTLGPQASAQDIRDAAKEFSPDDLPDIPARAGDASGSRLWVYGAGQYELSVLDRLVTDGFAANKFVHYASNYGSLQPDSEFRRPLSGEAGVIMIHCADPVTFSVDGLPVEPSLVRSEGSVRQIVVPAYSQYAHVRVHASENSPAAFAVIQDGPLVPGSAWEVRFGVGSGDESVSAWQPSLPRVGGMDTPPHADREPTVELRPTRDGRLFALRAPVLGRPVISCEGVPRISAGESLDEARASPEESETRLSLRRLPDGRWTTEHELGFRYLMVHDAQIHDVVVEASVHPVPRRGAFVCSDERLNEIWSISEYTLRLCMHDLMLDGIKRDRMPWMGDQALNTISNAYAFAEGEVVRDGLVGLGQPRHGYVNGISDYSLWWLINSLSYQRYFGDSEHLRREQHRVHAFTANLATYADERGVFVPKNEPDSFPDAADGGVFIDWGVTIDSTRTYTALQILWYWALRSAAEILAKTGHAGAERWNSQADLVARTLHEEAWDPHTGTWREYFGAEASDSPYPNMLAVLSGLTPAEVPGMRMALTVAERVGTPFMTAFALRALARAGAPELATERIRALWGDMVDAGARTFWEEFGEGRGDSLEMYGRPFGKSLCHAWSSGPAALLPETILGIRPVTDGWREFTVEPHLGSLGWAAAVVPTPCGEIVVHADKGMVTVQIPKGATLLTGGLTEGPCTVTYQPDTPAQQQAKHSPDLAPGRLFLS